MVQQCHHTIHQGQLLQDDAAQLDHVVDQAIHQPKNPAATHLGSRRVLNHNLHLVRGGGVLQVRRDLAVIGKHC